MIARRLLLVVVLLGARSVSAQTSNAYIQNQTLVPQPASYWIAGSSPSTPVARIGTGAYNGTWPGANWGNPANGWLSRGTAASPATSSSPMLAITSHGNGPWNDPWGNTGEMVVYSSRANGPASGIVAAAIPKTKGYGAIGIASHVLMEHGSSATPGDYETGFALWGSCQKFSPYDNCSVMELNPVNNSVDPPSNGEYVSGGLANALALVAVGSKKSSSGLFIGTQNTTTAQFQRGIDFQQGSIANYAIVLPNNAPIVYRSQDDSTKVAVVNLSNLNDTLFRTGGWFHFFNSAGVLLATLDSLGNLSVLGGVWLSAVAFSGLGGVPPAGTMRYCTNCTTAPTCTSGGSGHMAVSNGSAWTCQ